MAAEAIGVDLNETTNTLFAGLRDQGIEFEVTTEESIPVARAGGAVFPLGKDYMFVDGERIQLPGISVFAPMTGQVYVARSALDYVSTEPSSTPPQISLNYVGVCDPISQCGPCEGDCDSDEDCEQGLRCFKRKADSFDEVPGCIGGATDATGHDFCTFPW